MARRNILSHFVGTPRDVQAAALPQIQAALDSADVVVANAPPATGKTKLGECVARYAASKRGGLALDGAIYTVPNNMLLDQFLSATRGFATIRRRDMYGCVNHGEWSCETRRARIGTYCRSQYGGPYAKDACPYTRDLRRARSDPKLAVTMHSVLAHDLRRQCMVFDEAHLIAPALQEMGAVHLWQHEYGWRGALEEPEDVLRWLSDALPAAQHTEATDLLWSVLTGPNPTHMLDLSPRDWRGSSRPCISLVPLDVRSTSGLLLDRAEKLVLMSATIGPRDIEALGLDRRRVAYVEIPSPIPPDRRPVEFVPVADMRFAGREVATRQMIRWLLDEYLPAWSGCRGLIHATYEFARALRAAAPGHPRLQFHEQSSKAKAAALKAFLEIRPGGDDRVLVGSGMEEGLDLAGELAAFQCITAVPRLSLVDPAVAWLAEHRPEQYEWECIKRLVQASGRVSRRPDDRGVTTIADASAGDRELRSNQLPAHFRDALMAGRRPRPQSNER